MTDVAELLDTLVPPYEGTGDWNRVLRDADIERHPLRTPRRISLRVAAAVVLVAAIAGLVAFWPATRTGPSVLDRALAATGDGEVLHLVYESGLPRTLVDLETGERTELRADHEVWFDPQAGLREIQRFEGVVQFDVSLSAGEVSAHASAIYTSLGAGYRQALESGAADVIGEEVVDGTPVYWIRIEDGHDVAVSRETFEPVFVRITQGEPPALDRIVSYETVEAGSAPLEARSTDPAAAPPAEHGSEVALDDAAALLGRDAVWAGASLHGFPLVSVRELRFPGDDAAGVSLMYGSAQDGPHVEIMEAATLADGLTMLVGLRGYAPPEGTALVAGTMALLRSNGLAVAIHAQDEEMAIAVARSLQPYSG